MIESLPSPFADHFSAVAPDYAAARPEYPDALFAWIASVASANQCVWEAAHAVQFAAAWDNPTATHTLRWPMFLHARRKAA